MRKIKCYMTQSTWYKGAPNNFTPKGILFHSTAANNPYISRYVQPDDNAPDRDTLLNTLGRNRYGNDWNHIYRKAGVNFWIGKLADGSIATCQVGPENKQPWGCGGGLNETHIQFEICESDLNDKAYFDKVYKEAIELCVDICKRYNINPKATFSYCGKAVPAITDHAGSYKLGLGSNHSDVGHWFKRFLGNNYLDVIRDDIEKGLKGGCDEMGCPYWINGKCTKGTTISNKIEVGDLVQITGNTYYNGRSIPSWVKNQNWFVAEVSGDRVVINDNEKHTNKIMSPVKIENLKIIKKKG